MNDWGGGGIYQLISRKGKWMAGLTLTCKVIRTLRRLNSVTKPKYFVAERLDYRKEVVD